MRKKVSIHLGGTKAVQPSTGSEFIAQRERSQEAIIPFEEYFQPLIDFMKKKKQEVDRRARVAHEVFGKLCLRSFSSWIY